MTQFANAVSQETRKTFTENGATAYNSTNNPLLNLFSCIGSMRGSDANTIETMLAEAYQQDPLQATKCIFYTRDIRGERVGKGERKTFRIMLRYMADHHPEAIIPNIPLIPIYGRFDDLYELLDTKCEDHMLAYMKQQLKQDIQNMKWNKQHPDKPKKPVSLLCKWVKSIHTTSTESMQIAKRTLKRLGFYTEKSYRKTLEELRRHINLLERLMSDNQWDNINYEHIPSQAMKLYKSAFAKHSVERFQEYKEAVAKGEAIIHTDTLFPYDIIAPYIDRASKIDHELLELQWKNLPDFIGQDINALVVCDVSGSMFQPVNGVPNLPGKAAIGLALYFAEHNTGAFHNLFMTFSDSPEFVKVKGETLRQKIKSIASANWDMSTNLEAAFSRILQLALDEHLPQDEMPKSLIVISDMQINEASNPDEWNFHKDMAQMFKANGYELPLVIYWNVNSKTPTMLTDDPNRDGVQLISGLNAKTFSELIDNAGLSATDLMDKCLNNPRYDAIRIEK